MRATPRTLALCLCLPWAQGLCAPSLAPTRTAPPSYSYVSECDLLTKLAYWATLNTWVDRKRVHHGAEKGWEEDARHDLKAMRGSHPRSVRSVEGTAASAFGTDGTTINQRDAQEAQQNALVTAVGIHDDCLQHKGDLAD